VIALLGFITTSSIAIHDALQAKEASKKQQANTGNPSTPDTDPLKPPAKEQNTPLSSTEPFTYVANILVGLVGGIVAVGLGQPPPPMPGTAGSSTPARNAAALGAFLVENKKVESQAVVPGDEPTQNSSAKNKEIIGLIYSLVYLIISVATIVTWIYTFNVAPPVIKSLATVSLGMFVPVVNGFFRDK
jgi:hypothetical protein